MPRSEKMAGVQWLLGRLQTQVRALQTDGEHFKRFLHMHTTNMRQSKPNLSILRVEKMKFYWYNQCRLRRLNRKKNFLAKMFPLVIDYSTKDIKRMASLIVTMPSAVPCVKEYIVLTLYILCLRYNIVYRMTSLMAHEAK